MPLDPPKKQKSATLHISYPSEIVFTEQSFMKSQSTVIFKTPKRLCLKVYITQQFSHILSNNKGSSLNTKVQVF